MTDTTKLAENRSINEIVGQKDWNEYILKNKSNLIALVAFIVVAVLGYGFFINHKNKSNNDLNQKIYNFEASALKTFETSKDANALVTSFKNLHSEVGNYSGLTPTLIKISDALIAQDKLAEALMVLNDGESISKNEYAQYFTLSRLAVVNEDLGNTQAAIDALLKMNSNSVKIFEGKNYLDLGRLYLKLGNKDKAKSSFQYVVEKAKDESEFVKLAKLYLSKI